MSPVKLQTETYRKQMVTRERVFALAKGFYGKRKNCIRVARQAVEKALQYQYRDRRQTKRDMRSLWIMRVNAASREHGVKYGEFMSGLAADNVRINRKMLAEIAVTEPNSFMALVERVKMMRG